MVAQKLLDMESKKTKYKKKEESELGCAGTPQTRLRNGMLLFRNGVIRQRNKHHRLLYLPLLCCYNLSSKVQLLVPESQERRKGEPFRQQSFLCTC